MLNTVLEVAGAIMEAAEEDQTVAIILVSTEACVAAVLVAALLRMATLESVEEAARRQEVRRVPLYTPR